MDRRRALMAASMQSESDTHYEFPIYIAADYCEEGFMGEACYKDANKEGEKIYTAILTEIIENGSIKGGKYIYSKQPLVIFENVVIPTLEYDDRYYNIYGSAGDGTIRTLYMYPDGSIIFE